MLKKNVKKIKISYENHTARLDVSYKCQVDAERIAQLAEHSASIPTVVGSISTSFSAFSLLICILHSQ